MGQITAAVPQAAASLRVLSSSTGTGRRSTDNPYNPEKIMRRGFLPVLQGGRQLSSVEEVDSDTDLQILMIDGSIEGQVSHIHKDKTQ